MSDKPYNSNLPDFDSLKDESDISDYADGGGVAAPDFDSLVPDPVTNTAQASSVSQSVQPQAPASNETLPDFDSLQDDTAKYSTPTQQAITALEGVGQGVLGPVAPLVEGAFGTKVKDIRGRQAANPGMHTMGEAAGFGGSMFTGEGEAALVGHIGETTAKAIGEGANLASIVGRGVARGAVENAMLQAGDEVTKMVISDPNQSAQTSIADIGLAGLLGGGIGGALGGLSPIWKAAAGNKLGQMVEDFKGRINDHIENPEPLDAVTKELGNYYNNVKSAASEVYGPEGLKAQDIAKVMPEMNDKISTQATDISDKLNEALNGKLKNDSHLPLLQDAANKFTSVLDSNDPTQIFDATQNLKQQLQEWGKYNKAMTPLAERSFRNTAKDLAYDLRESLEDTSVWGKAAERQQSINKAFSEYLPSLNDFEKKFTTDVAGEKVIDPGKLNTFINQIGKPNADIKQTMLKNFIDKSEAYKDVIASTHANLGIDSPIADSPLNATQSLLKERTTGGRLADIFIQHGLSDLGSKGLGAGVGAAIGHTVGMGEIGSLLGAHALGPFFKSTIPAIVKPMMSMVSSGVGLKASADYIASVAKGDTLITRAAKSIFKPIGYTATQNLSEASVAKLDKRLKDLQTDQTPLINNGTSVAHYLPDHATALSTTSQNAVNYLNSLRPDRTKQSPLDAEPKPSNMQKASYTRALSIAQQPLTVFESIKKGTLTPTDVLTLKTLYPSLYNSMVNKLTTETIEASHKKTQIPYKTKIGISMFVGQPMDSTMTPNSIQATQASQQPGGGQPAAPPPKQRKGTSVLSKASGIYQTAGQAAEADQLKH